ncbi:DNA polymerase IV [Gulosibacter macacae]|uniref:DNA polymerase IV n=1 Tax=Gulosibacter macacae TaxID=2488791 RepID=UPI002286F116|nr:DNA polymerase IV [Gulosibacter macacae]
MSRKDLGDRVTGAFGDDSSATILHVDMDAFFVAVELLDRPDLRGEPVIVGGAGGRGVVSSASYEARAFGVHAAMPIGRALQLCPKATVLPGNMQKYRDASARVMAVFRDITPLVEPLSIDEAFLDVAGATKLFGSPTEIAQLIRRRVLEITGLTCSVGAASTKFVAKLASGKCKPNGMLVIPAEDTIPFLHALPVGALWGVGATTEQKLRSRGISTVFELAHTPRAALDRMIGKAMGERLADLAWGRDPRGVEIERREKSVSHEQTFDVDVTSHAELEREVRAQADAVGARLRRAGLVAGTVAIKLRWANFETLSRQVRLERPSNTGLVLFRAAAKLLDEAHGEGRAVRLIGVRADHLSDADDATSLTLWDEGDDEEWEAAERAVDTATARFGKDALRPASLLGRHERRDRGTGLSERPNRPSQGLD